MPIIAVMNRKGGSGKSTLAIQIAGWFAVTGTAVLLGNSDRQHSVGRWLQRRSPSSAPIGLWHNETGKLHRSAPEGTQVVIDTPGGMQGLELATQLARIDAIVVPVGPSMFDLETSIEFLEELGLHPRVISGRCHVAVVGMRWPLELLLAWQHHRTPRPLPLLTVIAEAPMYRHCMDEGRSVFDSPALAQTGDLSQWQPLLTWLTELPQTDHRHAQLAAKPSRLIASLGPQPTARSATRSALQGGGTGRRQQMRSPESFVDTLPPDGINVEELKAVQSKTRRQFALDMCQASRPRRIEPDVGAPRMVLQQAPAATSPLSSATDRSDANWLMRLFRTR